MLWPNGKRFAFTIVDDTDSATLATVQPVYDFLSSIGIATTKTVWPLRSAPGTPLEGDTLEDEAYREWILQLQSRGFEIAYHGAAAEPSKRSRSEQALDFFNATVGHHPRIYASHSDQKEAMYWGASRLSGLSKILFSSANRLVKRDLSFSGETEGSAYFWGDLCRDRIEYTRNLTFSDINTLKCDPSMPYHEPSKRYVRYWFSASNAPQADSFCALISEANQDQLVREGGLCIAYTHFAYKFVRDDVIDPEFVRLMRRLASLPGWFAPASSILDHLKTRPEWTGRPGSLAMSRMQWRWLRDNLWSNRGRKYMRRLRRRVLRR